jgi:hypothetical protein
MLPDQELGAKIESDEKQRLEDIRSKLSQEQVGGGGGGVLCCLVDKQPAVDSRRACVSVSFWFPCSVAGTLTTNVFCSFQKVPAASWWQYASATTVVLYLNPPPPCPPSLPPLPAPPSPPLFCCTHSWRVL